jgi:hypothetical protein
MSTSPTADAIGELGDEVRNAFANSFEADGQHTGNVADMIGSLCISIDRAARHLGNGDATEHMGALEAHGKAILDASEKIADAIHDLAEAVRSTPE